MLYTNYRGAKTLEVIFTNLENEYNIEKINNEEEKILSAMKDLEGLLTKVQSHKLKTQELELENIVVINKTTGYRSNKIDIDVFLYQRPVDKTFEIPNTHKITRRRENFEGKEWRKARKYAEYLAKEFLCEIKEVKLEGGSWYNHV